jgi:hypothetical protein
VNLGGKGKIRVRLIMDGKPYSTNSTVVEVWERNSCVLTLKRIETGVFEGEIQDGIYNFKIGRIGSGIDDIWLSDQEVNPGETLEKVVDLGG